MESMVAKWKGVTGKSKRSKADSAPEPERREEESKDGYIRSKAQEIVDVLGGKGSDPPTRTFHAAAKFTKVCEILLEVAGNKPKPGPERPVREAEAPIKPATSYQTQVIADLEAKYIDIKEERDSLKRERDSLAGRTEQLQREVKLLLVS